MYKIILISLVLVFSISVNAKVIYQIEMTDPEHHLAEVTIKLPKGLNSLELRLPAWRTGYYKILDQANGVRKFSAKGANGELLDWKRVDKSRWLIDNPSQASVQVNYQLYANELGRRTRHIDDSHAFLDATAVFMYEPSLIEQIHLVNLKVPEKWKSYSGMVEVEEHQFIAQNYHQLADSPIETGINEAFEFVNDKRQYQVVFWGKGNKERQQIVDDLEALVSQSQTIWKGYPYNKYVFMIHSTSGAGGATEHLNSTVIQRARDRFNQRDDYLDSFLRTASHELVHTWNVKAYRPKGLVPYDYQQENYSELLWIAEGSTSYFEDRLLLTAKLQTVKEFLTSLSQRVDKFQRSPGHSLQSVSEASFEKWIAQGGDFARNHSVNIYSEGFMASWLLDFQMLQDSQLNSGYKELHQELYAAHENDVRGKAGVATVPYDKAMLLEIIQRLTKLDYNRWWSDNIEAPIEIDFDKLLDKAGLKFASLKESDYKVWTGFKSNQKLVLTGVEKGSPAWKAGLTIDDQLLAVNGYQVTNDNLDNWLGQYESNEEVELTLFRDQQLIRKTIKLGRISKKPRKIELVEKPTEQQKQFFEVWLGVEFPSPE